MNTIEYRTIDKSAWIQRGEWDNEPDKVQWQDEATGLPCLAVRNPRSGVLCGYVGVSEGHPFFGVEYSDTAPISPENARRLLAARHALDLYAEEVEAGTVCVGSVLDCHGGVTFSGFCQPQAEERGICHIPGEGEPDRVWWLGFDCGHHMDLSPGYDLEWASGHYRDLPYVKSQCRDLASQLASLNPSKEAGQ